VDGPRAILRKSDSELAIAQAAGTPEFLPVPVEAVEWLGLEEADREWVLAKSVPHPRASVTQLLRLGNLAATILPRTYIYCTEGKDPDDPMPPFLAHARSDLRWRNRELAANRGALVTPPQPTAEVLLSPVDHAPVTNGTRLIQFCNWL
jgi:hypothetical protein